MSELLVGVHLSELEYNDRLKANIIIADWPWPFSDESNTAFIARLIREAAKKMSRNKNQAITEYQGRFGGLFY